MRWGLPVIGGAFHGKYTMPKQRGNYNLPTKQELNNASETKESN